MTKQRLLRHIRLLSNNETIFEEVDDFLFVLIAEADLRTVPFIVHHCFLYTNQKILFRTPHNKLKFEDI